MARPQKTGNQICPICKKQGFSYRNTFKISNTDSYFYIRFRHNDRTLKDHTIDRIVKEKEPLKYATEYNRSNQVTSFVYNPYLNNIKYDPLKHWDKNKAISIIIYNIDMMKIPVEFKDEIKEIAITEKEKDWGLNSEPVKTQFRVKHFYNEILHSKGIVTFGDKALEYREKIYEIGYIGNVSEKMDKFGMFGEILNMRKKKEKLSKSYEKTYNYPRRTLPHPQVNTKKVFF